jgi:hypothetical protein
MVGGVMVTVASFLQSKATVWTPFGGSLATMKTPTGAVDLGEALWAIIMARVAMYQRGGNGGSELGFVAFGSSKKVTGLNYL